MYYYRIKVWSEATIHVSVRKPVAKLFFSIITFTNLKREINESDTDFLIRAHKFGREKIDQLNDRDYKVKKLQAESKKHKHYDTLSRIVG